MDLIFSPEATNQCKTSCEAVKGEALVWAGT
jgi:hypothetical protein